MAVVVLNVTDGILAHVAVSICTYSALIRNSHSQNNGLRSRIMLNIDEAAKKFGFKFEIELLCRFICDAVMLLNAVAPIFVIRLFGAWKCSKFVIFENKPFGISVNKLKDKEMAMLPEFWKLSNMFDGRTEILFLSKVNVSKLLIPCKQPLESELI